MQECIDACIDARSARRSTMDYCMRQGGKMMNAALMRMLLDCSDTCGMCADMIMRDSDSMREMCRLCADMGTQCADMCAKMPTDSQMVACAEACRRAAAACRELAAAK
jgi:hypothetical protein